MIPVKSRRDLYSEATKAALLDEATKLFGERGFARTSLEEIASAALVTRGAVYHHFASKKALFEAVLVRRGSDAIRRVAAATALHDDPWDATVAGVHAFLDESCDPVYGKLVWQEGPLALGWEDWRRCEQLSSYALVERLVQALMDGAYLEHRAQQTTVRICYEMLSGAGLAIAEAPEGAKPDIRDECEELVVRMLGGLRQKPAREQGSRAAPS
jgi:AcrR family transcriptional regulator